MNQPDPIGRWRKEPTLRRKDPKRGWDVEFAQDGSGKYPSLDYAQGTDEACDPKDPFTERNLATLAGRIQTLLTDGLPGLPSGDQFKRFEGVDKGMCEFRFGAFMGQRVLGFLRDGKVFVITNGFVKPNDLQTPREAKERAYKVLREHEHRQAKGGEAHGSTKHPDAPRRRA